jgi:BCD family chlorophyll transporter-like MFS transporter
MKLFGWASVARLDAVQACLETIVALTTWRLNRVMVVGLALAALLPGLLVARRGRVQTARPRMDHGSDVGERHTAWIIGGMAVLAVGGVLAALATGSLASDRSSRPVLAVLGCLLVGLGVSASGTSLLVLLAKRVRERRRGGAATVLWMVMTAGFALTVGLAGHFLDPHSPQRLVGAATTLSILAFVIPLIAVRGLEGHGTQATADTDTTTPLKPSFRAATPQVWDEPVASRFTSVMFLTSASAALAWRIASPIRSPIPASSPGAQLLHNSAPPTPAHCWASPAIRGKPDEHTRRNF